MQVKATGIAWYRREDYDRLKAMFKDGWKLADTFDSWLSSAQNTYDKLTCEGQIVEKAYIDPDTFPEWCRAHRKEMDAHGRTAYANECVARKFGAEVQ